MTPSGPSPAVTAQPGPGAPVPGTPPPGMPAPGTAAPAPEGVTPLSVEEAVNYAYRNNPRIAEAAALIREARGRVTQRRATRLPQFGVNNFVFRQGPVVPSSIPGGNPAVPAYRYNTGIFVSQIVYDWGQRRNEQRAAQREVNANTARRAETENDVRFVVATTYFDVQRAQQLVEVAQERVASTTEQLRVARARYEADVAPRFDVIRSEAELAAAQQELIDARNDVSLGEAALNTALGRLVTTPVFLQPVTPPSAPEQELTALRDSAAVQRPLLEAFRQDIAGSESTVRARRAENKPQVAFTGTYDRPNPGGFASQTYRYGVGLTMTWPFFDSGFTRGRVREAQGQLDANRARLEQARQRVDLDIRQAQLDIAEALARTETSRTEQTSAREALRVAQVRYNAGVGTNVEVTDAQVAVARAGQNLANAQFDYLAAVARLEFATGTSVAGLTPAPPTPLPQGGRPAPRSSSEPPGMRR